MSKWRWLFVIPVVIVMCTLSGGRLLANSEDTGTPSGAEFIQKTKTLHMPFIANEGQMDEMVKFYAKTFGGTVFVTKDGEIVYALPKVVKESEMQSSHTDKELALKEPFQHNEAVALKEAVVNGKCAEITGEGKSVTQVNYFTGNDSSKWKTNISTYETANLGEVYEGIDLKLKAYGDNVEKLFTVRPDADPETIRLKLSGAKALKINKYGQLEVRTKLGAVKFTRPVAYQEIDGKRVEVPVSYRIQKPEARKQKTEPLNPQLEYGFKVASYNKSKDLVIDPLLASTYLGGSSYNYGYSLALDTSGNVYVAGGTTSSDFPTTTGAYDTSCSSGDAFVSKLNSGLTSLLASTFLGGSGSEYSRSLALDTSGNVYVTGYTYSSDFPTTRGAYDTSIDRNTDGYYYDDIFVSKLNSDLTSLLASTFLGGSHSEYYDTVNSLALDASGNVYVCGSTQSTDFPTTSGAYDTSYSGGIFYDVFVSKLNSGLTSLLASTFLGGSSFDMGKSIALDTNGNVYVCGSANKSSSTNFPTTSGAYDTSIDSYYEDVFVSKLDSGLTSLLASTFLGGSGSDEGRSLALDISGNVYVTGYTDSSDFPTTRGAYDTSIDGYYYSDIFVSKLNSDLTSLLASTFLGGSNSDFGNSLTLDTNGNVYVTGHTSSSDFPTTSGAYDTSYNGDSSNYFDKDAFVSKLNSGLTSLLASTYLGGSGGEDYSCLAIGTNGNVYVTGSTGSSNFPTTGGAYDTFQDYGGAFVSKFYLPNDACKDSDLSIGAITPESGGDTGSVSMLIYGCNFTGSSTVKLAKSGETDIVGDSVGVDDDGKTIFATFDLNSKSRGAWDVVVTNPDSTSVTLYGAFTIEEGRTADVWVDILARDRVLVGRQQTFTILVGNRGNVNAIGVPICIAGIPKDCKWKREFKITDPPQVEGEEPVDWTDVPVHIETDDEIIQPLFLPLIPPGSTGTLKMSISVPTSRSYQLSAWVNPPYFNASSSSMSDEAADCNTEVALVAGQKLLELYLNKVLHTECAKAIWGTVISVFKTTRDLAIQKWRGNLDQDGLTFALAGLGVSAVKPAMECTDAAVKTAIPLIGMVSAVASVYSAALDINGVYNACKAVSQRTAEQTKSIQTVTSFDPNEVVGSEGVGDVHYISGNEPLRYSIFFENMGTATAAAQEITIIDQLGTATADLDTFSFGKIAFGDWEAAPTQGLSEYSTEVDLRPDRDVTVRINASLNNDTGRIIWHMVAVDPDTSEFPEDPSVGILPPNVTPPEGEGNVLFTVMPKTGLATGTEIRNKAKIIFDVNEPIETNEWMNTIDNSNPSSHVLPLDAVQYTATFDVQWEGSDDGAGIKDYTLYVSTNGGTYTAWMSNETGTLTTVTGQPGSTYAFYTIAQDKTGNTEEAPTEPDAITYIDESVVMPTPTPATTSSPAIVPTPTPTPTPTATATATPTYAGTPTPISTPPPPPTNAAPVTNAGADQSVYVGNTVTLDGSGSKDVDGNSLTYSWAFTTKPDGSTATLSDAAAVKPTFTVDKAGTYVVSLIVNDGTVDSQPDTVTISTINVAPVANAGTDQSVNVGDSVSLNGGGSKDADGDAITYSWSITTRPSGSTAELSGAATASPTFTADVAEAYVVQLVVNDGAVNSSPDTVTITANEASEEEIEVEVDIKPETINLRSKGKFKAVIKLPEPYSADEVVLETVVCGGAHAIKGRFDDDEEERHHDNRYTARFNVQDLSITANSRKEEVTLTVTGELEDGTKFTGSDTIRVKSREKEKEKGKDKDK